MAYKVGKHTAKDLSFLLAFDKWAIGEGSFGAIAPNWCDDCGPIWGELEPGRMTFRGSWEQPPEYADDRCPNCGSRQCGENYNYHAFKTIRRYRRIRSAA